MSWEFPAESLFIPWRASVGSPRTKNPPDDNKSRIPYSEGSLLRKHNFLKFKHENVIKMKNKPDLALLRRSNLSNEIKKRAPISVTSLYTYVRYSYKSVPIC
jgi:hypothetical protein